MLRDHTHSLPAKVFDGCYGNIGEDSLSLGHVEVVGRGEGGGGGGEARELIAQLREREREREREYAKLSYNAKPKATCCHTYCISTKEYV